MSTPGELATSTVSTPGEVATSTASTGERECITAEKITTPVKAANVNKDYAYLLKLFQKINNPVAVPSASATAAPVAVASASVEDKKKNEEIEERGDEESDDDMGISLYD